MGYFDAHAARLDLRIVEYPVERVDRSARHAGGLQFRQPIVEIAHRRDTADNRHHRLAVLHPQGVGREPLVLHEVGAPGNFQELGQLAVVADTEDHMAVARRKNAIGHNILMRIAGAARHLATDQIVHRLIG